MRAFQFLKSGRCLVIGSLALAACSDSPTAPLGRDPEIINTTDNFQYQISDIESYSGTRSYQWSNTGTTAVVNQSAAVASGSASLTLLDANGVQVYSRSLADNGTFSTSAGAAGTWTIRVAYDAVSATVNFRVDKAN